MTLYLRGILDSLNVQQLDATPIYEDNAVAIAMENGSRPTRRTRHIKLKHFALLDWTETDQLILSTISTHDNPADGLTEILVPQTLSRHSAILLGKRKPSYCLL